MFSASRQCPPLGNPQRNPVRSIGVMFEIATTGASPSCPWLSVFRATGKARICRRHHLAISPQPHRVHLAHGLALVQLVTAAVLVVVVLVYRAVHDGDGSAENVVVLLVVIAINIAHHAVLRGRRMIA